MEMVSTITSLITNVVNFAGGLLLLFGAVTLGTNLKDHNGPGISRGAWSIAGGVLIIAVATYLQFHPDHSHERRQHSFYDSAGGAGHAENHALPLGCSTLHGNSKCDV